MKNNATLKKEETLPSTASKVSYYQYLDMLYNFGDCFKLYEVNAEYILKQKICLVCI